MGHRVGNDNAHVQNKIVPIHEIASESFETKLQERIMLILTRVNMQATAAGSMRRSTVFSSPQHASQPPDFTKMAILVPSKILFIKYF
jgi:hypothetical protein